MMMEDKIFIDTNVLVYLTDEDSEFHERTRKKLNEISSFELWFSYQVIREFSVIVTRHGRIENPLLSADAVVVVNDWKKILNVCEENENVNNNLLKLIEDYDLKGKRIHDANIVATMMSYGIKKIFTYNEADFKSFKEVEIIK